MHEALLPVPSHQFQSSTPLFGVRPPGCLLKPYRTGYFSHPSAHTTPLFHCNECEIEPICSTNRDELPPTTGGSVTPKTLIFGKKIAL